MHCIGSRIVNVVKYLHNSDANSSCFCLVHDNAHSKMLENVSLYIKVSKKHNSTGNLVFIEDRNSQRQSHYLYSLSVGNVIRLGERAARTQAVKRASLMPIRNKSELIVTNKY